MKNKVLLISILSLLLQGAFAQEKGRQYLVFQITPATAILEVNDQIWELNVEGEAREYVDFGTYSYRVQAKNYYAEEGSVTVNNPNDVKVITVMLRPKFGWIEVAGTDVLQGASVYIDNSLVGKAPCKSGPLESGQHMVRIAKEYYDPYNEMVTVSDNEVAVVSPSLRSDFAVMTLVVDSDAEIWINDEWKGTRTWTGFLANGIYKIECKMPNHETSTLNQEITPDMTGQTINLSAPIPIMGSLNVESNPLQATLYIDGVEMGFTPRLLKEIIVGEHVVKLSKDGYADYSETITISKGERKQFKASLLVLKDVKFICNAPNAQLSIDGVQYGSASSSYALPYGTHRIKATASAYHDYNKTITVNETTSSQIISMVDTIGSVNGIFSVSDDKKVYFSKGNLWYRASSNQWGFAKSQYDYIRSYKDMLDLFNTSTSIDCVDLFAWGTSGYNHGAKSFKPMSTKQYNDDNYYAYGDANYSLFEQSGKADWGYNAITNGGNTENQWRTLTMDEWEYVFSVRNTPSGLRFAKAQVGAVNGVILLPDDWDKSYGVLNNTNQSDAGFSSNTITAAEWRKMEKHGAVFLPAGGTRDGIYAEWQNNVGYYWSATSNSNLVRCVHFDDKGLDTNYYSYRGTGLSVRLVRPAY